MGVHICIYFNTYMYDQDILGKIQNEWMHERLSSKVYALEFCNLEILFRQDLDEFRVYIFRAKE